MSAPSVAVVMTALGEPVERLERCLASVVAQDYTGEVEIIVALGKGDAVPSLGRVITNPTGARSAGLNLAIRSAAAEIIVRVDARSALPPGYITRCVARLAADAGIGVVGGVQFAEVQAAGPVARGIARALRNQWATGGAAYRRVGASGSVDTVYLGVFRRLELLELGGWNESLAANEDFELCQRYRERGQRVWLEAGVVVSYEPRPGLHSLWRQYVAFGRSKVQYWRHTGERPGTRQLLPLIGAPLLLATTLWKPAVLVAAVLGLVGLDHVADPKERDPRVRVVSLASYVPIIGGWIAGVVSEATRRSSSVR